MKQKILLLLLSGIMFAGVLQAQNQVSDSKDTDSNAQAHDTQLEQRVSLLEDAVKKASKLKITGYIQTQFQWGETDAEGTYFKLRGRNSHETDNLENFTRFGIRRGRVKFTYEDRLFEAVLQPDFNERASGGAVTFKDIYFQIRDPWFGTNIIRTGLFHRPFGHEVTYSTTRRESPERARIIQELFPDERDVGVMLVLQAPKTSPWNILKLEGGLFAGNGARAQIDSRMDFIGRLSAAKTFGNISISGGVSAYLGNVRQNDKAVYVMKDEQFVLESSNEDNIGRYLKREYFGADIQFGVKTAAGLTNLRAEYIFGEHPGNDISKYDFKPAALYTGPVYMRKVSGGYVLLAQSLGSLPLIAVAKYDWYNPNTGVSGNKIAASGSETGTGDIARSTWGLGMVWDVNAALRLTAYYDIVGNETTNELPHKRNADGKIIEHGWLEKRKADVFTFRLQYRF